MSAQHDVAARQDSVTPQEFGVGARFSVQPMTADFQSLILGALRAADTTGLHVITDDVSTYVGGSEAGVLRYLMDVMASPARSGVHTVAQVLLSRGCPGEVSCRPVQGAVYHPDERLELPRAGVVAAADWSLYPLGADDRSDHMTVIEGAVNYAQRYGTYAGSAHYVTRLHGDLADVLTTAAQGWIDAGRVVAHVTSHLTISLNPPDAPGAAGAGAS